MPTGLGAMNSFRRELWAGRKVFVTGHTGFKGSWLALWLQRLGSEVRGYALDPVTEPNLFTVARVAETLEDQRGDICDLQRLEASLRDFAPEVVFHLAAQPLVRASYSDPIATYQTNVIGTANVLEAVRRTASVRAVVIITTDKCYENREWPWAYRETDPLGGYDPYSSSKACAEIVTASFRQSYFPVGSFDTHRVGVATARAGNVIGGGDWSEARLIPDLIRGFESGEPTSIRSPHSVRPWQHVLEPLNGYLRLADLLCSTNGARFARAYNFGPPEDQAKSVAWIANYMAHSWGGSNHWFVDSSGPHEAAHLKLDSSLARAELGWVPRLNLIESLNWLIDWSKTQTKGEPMREFTLTQIEEYERLLDETV
jgi:CDP-glucose 4,6-dehydratase